jgi:hypothetical protein
MPFIPRNDTNFLSTNGNIPRYFNVSALDGSAIRGPDVWRLVPDGIRRGLDRMMTLTETEHPVLGTPFFQLHPCNTVGDKPMCYFLCHTAPSLEADTAPT